MVEMLLSGFGLRGFRSFYGPDIQFLAPLEKITLIAGQNNSGKSNILRVALNLQNLFSNPIAGLDVPRVPASVERFALAIRLGGIDEVSDRFFQESGLSEHARQTVFQLLANHAFDLKEDGSVWLYRTHYLPTDQQVSSIAQAQDLASANIQLNQYFQAVGFVGVNSAKDMAQEFIGRISKLMRYPTVRMVDASRRVTDLNNDGHSLIQRLAALQHPSLDNDSDREKFEAINKFLQTVTGDPSARLEVNYNATELNVRRDLLALPLENLGTGIAQVVMLAASASVEANTVVCMEEPEVHLHPLLQRKLLRYLKDETNNQYIIATHSAHLLDSSVASVFHATFTEAGTEIKFAGNPYELSTVCYDLGYRPSDLLQTNFAVWVEGPSDRIYIEHWLRLVNPNLREGIDYTIMFYGGRLLSHLSPDDPDVHDFISLRRLNRHLAILIDSDKAKQSSKINATKRRIVDAMKDPGMVWVTQGRNIENYVPPALLTHALEQVYTKPLVPNVDKWSDALRPAGDVKGGPDKVKVARAVTRRWKSGLNHHDLHKKVVELATLIEAANGSQSQVAVSTLKATPEFDLTTP